jgi:hypothetical protein
LLEESIIERFSEYDLLIKKILNSEIIPIPEGDYTIGENVELTGNDFEIFKILFSKSPSKSGSEEGLGSKGSGYGELALYWLLKKNYPNIEDSRGGGKPDLKIDEVGLEVKSYNTKQVNLGRFGSDNKNIEILNFLFGLYFSMLKIEDNNSKKKPSSLNFSYLDLIKIFDFLKEFLINDDFKNVDSKFLQNLYANIEYILGYLEIDLHNFSSSKASANILRKILVKKLAQKPGYGGYIVNIELNGLIKYYKIDKEKIDSITDEDINKYVLGGQGQLFIYPENLFI